MTDAITGTLKAREEHVRESWIKAMEARIVRGELQKCYRGEGVNQLQNCKELAERYASMIRENKVYRFSVLATLKRESLICIDQGIHGHRYRVDETAGWLRSKLHGRAEDVLYGIHTFAGTPNTYLNQRPYIVFHYLQ